MWWLTKRISGGLAAAPGWRRGWGLWSGKCTCCPEFTTAEGVEDLALPATAVNRHGFDAALMWVAAHGCEQRSGAARTRLG